MPGADYKPSFDEQPAGAERALLDELNSSLAKQLQELKQELSKPKPKPILCLDFDGVCHSYTSGWKGADVIPDPPVDGLFDFLLEAERYFEIHIFSTRSLQDGGIEAMAQWFDDWRQKLDKPPLYDLHFPVEKPPALVTIDDRAITFTGIFPDVDMLRHFKPWNKWNK
jgi:hypothetical protein